MSGQPRHMSLVESVTNQGIGLALSLALTFTVLPAFGYPVTVPDALWISAIYTVASVIRSYIVRRTFNWFQT